MYRRRIRQQSAEVSEAYLELIDHEEKRHDLAALAQRVNEVVENLGPAVTEAERKVLEYEVRKALEAQRDVYDSLIADTNSYLESVVEMDSRERQLVAMVDAFAKYCDERILWIRSATVFDFAHVRQLSPSLTWLFDPDGWKELAAVLRSDARAHPVLTVPIWLLFALLIMLHPRLRKETIRLGAQAARSSTTSYLPTLRALITTGVTAMAWAGPIGFLGYRLVAAESGSEFVVAWGKGLQTAALLLGTLEFLRQLCRKGGLAEAHFHWDKETLRAVRNAVRWFMVCGLPAALVVVVTESQHGEMIKNSLGRAAFVLALAALAYCMHRIMRPTGGAFDRVYAAVPQAWHRHGWVAGQ